jgi:hypothetical protein
VRAACGGTPPAVTAFGVDLLYEGLLLEIDASAVVGASMRRIDAGMRRGRYCHVSGPSVEDCIEAIEELGGSRESIGRMMLLVTKNAFAGRNAAELLSAMEVQWAKGSAPATTIAVVEGLPGGADLQADAFAIAG